MVHCYSLVHDDLPAMDDDDMRRGRPTVWARYGMEHAVNVGDAMFYYTLLLVQRLEAPARTPQVPCTPHRTPRLEPEP